MSDPYLGTRTTMRAFLDAVLPPGWTPMPGGDLDLQLSAIGDNEQTVMDFLSTLAAIRNPRTTPYLDELEREYGITPNLQIATAQRIQTLLLAKYARNQKSTINKMQAALNAAGLGVGGYGLIVYANDPPVDPGLFIGQIPQCFCNGPNAYCGFIPTGGAVVTAVCGWAAGGGGLWVVNGDIFTIVPQYLGCGDTQMNCGDIPVGGTLTDAVCGFFSSSSYLPHPESDPPQSARPLCFIIAAGVVYDGLWYMNDVAPMTMGMAFSGQSSQGGGEIASLVMAGIPNNLRSTLIEIILRWKPLHCWCALMCNFV